MDYGCQYLTPRTNPSKTQPTAKISPANLIRSKFGDQCKTVTVSSTLKRVYQFDQITFFSIRSKSIQLIEDVGQVVETIFLEHAFACVHMTFYYLTHCWTPLATPKSLQ